MTKPSIPDSAAPPRLDFQDVGKTFTLHQQNGVQLDVLDGASFVVRPGECVVLDGASGSGKSSLLKMAWANYRVDRGRILVRDVHDGVVDVAQADARTLQRLRQHTMAYVSQFLRVIPRVPTIDIVISAWLDGAPSRSPSHSPSHARSEAIEAAQAILSRLSLPKALWSLPPATFSGGEQQRVNIACNLVRTRPLILLDEPTASLDRQNSAVVIEMIGEAVSAGSAVLAIFHDQQTADVVATRRIDVREFTRAARARMNGAIPA